jgi:putative transcriptional regulator
MKNHIRVERARMRITQEELAVRVQVSRQAINAIEGGKYNLSTMLALKIAQVFGTTVDALFELEPSDWKT